MREILFRGKSVNTLEWVDGFYVREAGHFIKELPSAVSTPIHLVYPETVGQYTGLTDKNGKKIFEGDIVYSVHSKKRYPVLFGEYTYINDYGDEEAACGWYNEEHDNAYMTAMGNTEDWAVVVGNIHDNPELLEGKENAAD